jgi:hypothetical protein
MGSPVRKPHVPPSPRTLDHPMAPAAHGLLLRQRRLHRLVQGGEPGFHIHYARRRALNSTMTRHFFSGLLPGRLSRPILGLPASPIHPGLTRPAIPPGSLPLLPGAGRLAASLTAITAPVVVATANRRGRPAFFAHEDPEPLGPPAASDSGHTVSGGRGTGRRPPSVPSSCRRRYPRRLKEGGSLIVCRDEWVRLLLSRLPPDFACSRHSAAPPQLAPHSADF